ncbi:MAG: MATE family efflux transporter [Peptostreptococcaceae bacterium]|nr:MATE family efflux transporter [Peptostreptococcaceae bacterium]
MFKRFFGIGSLSRGVDIQTELPAEKEIYRSFFDIAWPAAMEGLLLMMISSVDLAMVGDLGKEAVAAVGIISQPRMLILCFVRSLAVAITAVIARRKGEGNFSQINTCAKQGLVLTMILSVALFAISWIFLKEIILLAGAKQEYLDQAISYGRYNMIAIFFMGLAIGINAAHTGMGNTRVIMVANVTGNIINMIFNYLLIYGIAFFPEMGVAGAGLATMIGSITAFGITLYSVLGKDRALSLLGKEGWALRPDVMRSYFNVGTSSFAEQIFERIGMFLYSFMVAQLGTVAFAAHYICMNLCDIYYSFGLGMSKASSAIAGQKLGEGRKDLAYICSKAGRRAGAVLDILAFVAYFTGRNFWMRLFTDDPQVIEIGMRLLIFVAICCFIQTQSMVYAGVLRGAGDTAYVARYSFWDIAVFRPIFTYLLCFPLGFGIYGAWIALLTDQSIRAFFASKRFYSKRWMEIKI